MPVYGATRPMQGHARSCMHMNIPPNLTHRRPRPRRYVMMSKRWTCVRRDPKALLTQQLLPLGLVRAFTYFAPHPRFHIFRPASAPSHISPRIRAFTFRPASTPSPSVMHPRLYPPSCMRSPAQRVSHSASHHSASHTPLAILAGRACPPHPNGRRPARWPTTAHARRRLPAQAVERGDS